MTLEFKGEDVLPFCFDNAFNDWQLNFLEGSIIVFSKKKQDIIKWDFLGDVYKEDELNFLPFTKVEVDLILYAFIRFAEINNINTEPVKFFEKLSNNYLELLDDKEDFNIIINVGESPNIKIFQAHSAILRYRSLYFRNELANIIILYYDVHHVTKRNLKYKLIFVQRYIYGGNVLLENHNASFIFELMLIAYEFLFDELAKYLEIHLIDNSRKKENLLLIKVVELVFVFLMIARSEAHWLRLNFTRTYQQSFQNNKLQELQKWCNDIVVKYPEKIFNSEEFNTTQENELVSLISRDDLQMEEVKIWNNVIKWGIAQNPGLSSDSKNWTHENFLALKATLQKCLPHIRYFQMSSDEVIDNVQPYQQILEKNLWDDITRKFMSPNRQVSSTILPSRKILTPTLPIRNTEPFSTVINEAHAGEIASWIDKKENTYSLTNNPYEFKLLLRGTRDGFTADSFWKLYVMKVNGTDEILGGYNPIGWDRNNSGYNRVKHSRCAIYFYNNYGPVFGSGSDLAMSNGFNQNSRCHHRQVSYEKRIRNASTFGSDGYSSFSVNEYEILQISKNPKSLC
ncbi:hypothetical protein C2G38_2239046 [Gigaspora rosea]|uniref:BTB domain-containing protein n=1 Tax=Gigaspora rosea TaxID=44941 RepID=A0A397W9R1_9GLOM|nr:hypothetical protein C2G38_2239046 [Gigaspora rosea]